VRKQFAEATQFQQDKDEVKRLLHKQTFDRIKSGNYRGLNLTDIKINLQGEIAMAEQVLQMSISERVKSSEQNELIQKIAELKEIYDRIEDRIKLDEETATRFNKPNKVGANLK
jgi:superfamily II RNA helicase